MPDERRTDRALSLHSGNPDGMLRVLLTVVGRREQESCGLEHPYQRRHHLRRSPLYLLALFASACGPDPTKDLIGPAQDPGSRNPPYRVISSVEFSGNLKLDLYLPGEGEGPFPGLVFVHGGGWAFADRTEFLAHAAHMASNGFVGAAVEHRLSPAHAFPAALHDVKAAVRWLRAHADAYNVDPMRIGVVGGSSGGNLAALLGTTGGMDQLEGSDNAEYSSAVQAVAAFGAPTDLAGIWNNGGGEWIRNVTAYVGAAYPMDPELWARASPISYVSPSSAPFLLLHGTEDIDVPFTQSQHMRDALLDAGVHAELFTAAGADHRFFNRPLWQKPALETMRDFFQRMMS